jgi:antitoxin component of MazEF toxin-antitoxin module
MKQLFKVRRSGGGKSLQVTLPAIWTDAAGLNPGDHVVVSITDDRLVITPAGRKDQINAVNK